HAAPGRRPPDHEQAGQRHRTERDRAQGAEPQVKPFRVVLADDHRMFVSGIKKLLEAEPDLTVVATASSDAEVVSAVHRTAADVVLLDVHLPSQGGIQAIHAVKAADPRCVVIMLTMDPSEELAVTAIRAGANGYLLKELSAEELTDYIRAALRG